MARPDSLPMSWTQTRKVSSTIATRTNSSPGRGRAGDSLSPDQDRHTPMPHFRFNQDDAQAVVVHLRSLATNL